MSEHSETPAIGEKGILIRANDTVYFRVYNKQDGFTFVDYEITNYDCEVVIIDKDAALIRNEAGDFLDYTTESMQRV